MQNREITGLWSARVPDGPDSDAHPDTVLLEGHVTFEPEYRVPLVYPGEHIVIEPMHAVIHEGVLYGETVVGDDVARGPLFLPVTVDDAANQSWSWVARFQGMRLGEYGEEVTLPNVRFQVPTGDDALDLSAVIPASQSGGTITVRGPQGIGIESVVAGIGELVVTLTDGTTSTVPMPDAVRGDSITAITPSEDGITIEWEGGPDVVVPVPGWEPPPGGDVGQVLTRTSDDVVWADTPTADMGSASDLASGTSTTGAVWSAETLAGYVTARVDEVPLPGIVEAVDTTVNRTVEASDVGKAIEVSSTSARTVTLPSGAGTPVGMVVEITRLGAGEVTVVAGSGVTILWAGEGTPTLREQYSVCTARKRSSTEWVLAGDLEAA